MNKRGRGSEGRRWQIFFVMYEIKIWDDLKINQLKIPPPITNWLQVTSLIIYHKQHLQKEVEVVCCTVCVVC